MSIPNSLVLKQAFKTALTIERLSAKLHLLLGDDFELPKLSIETSTHAVFQAPRRRGRPPGSGRKLSTEGSVSPLAGKPRPRSASGPLAPAVVKVLQRYNRPMKITEILIGLEQDAYEWTAKNPKQTLYVRIGKLAGVKKAGEGLYMAEELSSAPVGIIPESIAPSVEQSSGGLPY